MALNIIWISKIKNKANFTYAAGSFNPLPFSPATPRLPQAGGSHTHNKNDRFYRFGFGMCGYGNQNQNLSGPSFFVSFLFFRQGSVLPLRAGYAGVCYLHSAQNCSCCCLAGCYSCCGTGRCKIFYPPCHAALCRNQGKPFLRSLFKGS